MSCGEEAVRGKSLDGGVLVLSTCYVSVHVNTHIGRVRAHSGTGWLAGRDGGFEVYRTNADDARP